MCNHTTTIYSLCGHVIKEKGACPVQLTVPRQECNKTFTDQKINGLCPTCLEVRRSAAVASQSQAPQTTPGKRRSGLRGWIKEKLGVDPRPSHGSDQPPEVVPGVARVQSAPIGNYCGDTAVVAGWEEAHPKPGVQKTMSAPIGASAIVEAELSARQRWAIEELNKLALAHPEVEEARIVSPEPVSEKIPTTPRVTSTGSEKLAEEYRDLIGGISFSSSESSDDEKRMNGTTQPREVPQYKSPLESSPSQPLGRSRHSHEREHWEPHAHTTSPKLNVKPSFHQEREHHQVPVLRSQPLSLEPRTSSRLERRHQRPPNLEPRSPSRLERDHRPHASRLEHHQQHPILSPLSPPKPKEQIEADRMTTWSTFIPNPIEHNVELRRQGSKLRDGTFDHRMINPQRPLYYGHETDGQDGGGLRRQPTSNDLQPECSRGNLRHQTSSSAGRNRDGGQGRSPQVTGTMRDGGVMGSVLQEALPYENARRTPLPRTQKREQYDHEPPLRQHSTRHPHPPTQKPHHPTPVQPTRFSFEEQAPPRPPCPSTDPKTRNTQLQREEDACRQAEEKTQDEERQKKLAREHNEKLKREQVFQEGLRKAKEKVERVRDGRGNVDYSHNRL